LGYRVAPGQKAGFHEGDAKGVLHVKALLANVVAITVCSLANFAASE
jgi:hypothetical protein